MPTIGKPKPVPPPPATIRPVWGFVNDMKAGEGVFVTGYSKKALSRVRDRFKAVGIQLSVHKDVEDGVEGYTVRRISA